MSVFINGRERAIREGEIEGTEQECEAPGDTRDFPMSPYFQTFRVSAFVQPCPGSLYCAARKW